MRLPALVLLVVALTVLIAPGVADAQADARAAEGSTLKEAFRDFMGSGGSFATFFVREFVMEAIAAEIVAFPIGSSSGAFTYTFDPSLGASVLKNRSFGPWFAERASTMGERGQFTFGVSSQRVSYESFDGLRFEDGGFSELSEFPNERREARREFALRSETINFFGTVAVFRNLDVSVIVPITRVTIEGTNRVDQAFADPRRGRTFAEVVTIDRSSTGVSDVIARAKWRFAETRRSELAAQFEVRLPTGDPEELRGVGKAVTKGALLGSATFGRLSPHVNVTYTLNRAGYLGFGVRGMGLDELGYIAGVDAAVHRSLTVSGTLIGRRLPNAARSGRYSSRFQTGVDLRTGTLHPLLGAVGGKLKLMRQGILALHLLFPVNDQGLKPKLTAVLGFEYTF